MAKLCGTSEEVNGIIGTERRNARLYRAVVLITKRRSPSWAESSIRANVISGKEPFHDVGTWLVRRGFRISLKKTCSDPRLGPGSAVQVSVHPALDHYATGLQIGADTSLRPDSKATVE